MSWSIAIAALVSAFVIANGVDIAFIHRDPPPSARIATRTSRRMAGLFAIAAGVFNLIVNVF